MSGEAGLVGGLAVLIDRLVGADPVALGDGETVLALHRQLERLGAVTTRATAAFDASGEWGSDLARTPAQRRADAAVEMATRSAAAPADGRRPEPLFTVLVGYETLAGRICELADGTVVSPGSLVRWLDQAWVERVVFDGPSRVIDVGCDSACSPAPPAGRWR